MRSTRHCLFDIVLVFAEEQRRIFQRTKTHISENEDAHFRERRRKKNENAKKKTKTQKKTQTPKKKKKKRRRIKTKTRKKRISIGALYKSLQIINSSFIYKTYLDCLFEISIQHIILIFNEK